MCQHITIDQQPFLKNVYQQYQSAKVRSTLPDENSTEQHFAIAPLLFAA
jgi:hypothetical protein